MPASKKDKKQDTQAKLDASNSYNANRPQRTRAPKKSLSTVIVAAAIAPSKRKTSPKKKTTKKSSRKTKPTYQKMIFKALKELGTRTAHSVVAISKYLQANYPVPEDTTRYIRNAIKNLVEDDLLVRDKASYRMSAKARNQLAKKKAKKSTTTTTSSTGKKTTKRNTKNSSKASEPEKKTKKTIKAKSTKEDSPKKKKAAPKKKRSADDSDDDSSSSKRAKKSGKEEASNEKETGEVVVSKPHGYEKDFIWQYEDGTWRNYDIEASNVVEGVYQGYLANRGDTDVRAVHSGDWEYQVDFMAMKQTNIRHANHTVRRIRRVKCQ